MDYSPLDEIRQLVKSSEKILIITHRKPDGDGLGSALALFRVLQKLGKSASLVCSDPVPEMYDFLPGKDLFEQSFSAGRDFVLTLDCSKGQVGKLKYNLEGDKLKIIISPKSGSFHQEDVGFSFGPSKYDLIFVLDAGDLQQLGEIYAQNVDFFYSAPMVNIDHHASNTKFGKVNFVDPTASSTAEIMPRIFEALKEEGTTLIDAEVATLLLTGIITDTGSFQNPNTSPASFEVAASLLEAGGRQQEIIRRIYKTKKLSTLKLWGKILSKIHYDDRYKIVWSTISAEDLMESQADAEESGGIIDELLTNAPQSEVILLLKEYQDGVISGSLRTTSPAVDATKIAGMFGGGGHVQAAGFKIKGRDLTSLEQEVIAKIREFQAQRLGLEAEAEKQAEPAEEANTKKSTEMKPEEKMVVSEDGKTVEFNLGGEGGLSLTEEITNLGKK